MSFVDSYRRSVAQKQKDIASLSHEKAREQTKLADLNKRASSAAEALRRTSSASTAKSKANEIERYEKEAVNVTKKIATLEEKIVKKYRELHDEQAKLTREEQRESEKRQRVHAQTMTFLFLASEMDDWRIAKSLANCI